MKTSAAYYLKKAIECLPNKDEEILKALERIAEWASKEELLQKRKDNQSEKCLYIIETTDKKVRIGVSENPLKRIRAHAASCGSEIKQFYVTSPIPSPHKKENSLLKTFIESNSNHSTYPFKQVVDTFIYRFGDLKNPDFRLRYNFRYDEGPIFCSNGHKYKSYGTCSKSFHVKAREIHKAVTSGLPFKGFYFKKKSFPEYKEKFADRTKQF